MDNYPILPVANCAETSVIAIVSTASGFDGVQAVAIIQIIMNVIVTANVVTSAYFLLLHQSARANGARIKSAAAIWYGAIFSFIVCSVFNFRAQFRKKIHTML